mgnify:CR=1 FL=1
MSNCGCKTQPTNTPCTTCTPALACGCTSKCSCNSIGTCGTTNVCNKSSKYSEQKAGPVKIVAMHSLKILSPWVIPALGQKATVLVESSSVANGSEVYSELYGWFLTGDYDASNNSLTLLNSTADSVNAVNGLTMNEIGKPVPACALFSVGTPSNGLEASTGAQRCLLGQFYSKGVSDGTDPALIMSTQLSSIDGISPGDRIFFGVYEYIVKNIFTGNRVDFYNAGAGATAGTLVAGGLDCNGNCLLIVTIVGGSSPCDALEVQEVGSLIGCNGGIQQPFTSLFDNAVPQWDAESQTWKPVVLSIDTTVCVISTTGLAIVSGNAGPYTFGVNDNAELEVGDILKTPGYDGYFTITAKPDAFHITVTVSPTPDATVDIACDTGFCVLTCCEFQEICPPLVVAVSEEVPQTAPPGQGIDAVGTYIIAVGDVTFENPSNCRPAAISLTAEYGGAIRCPAEGTWQMDLEVDGNLYYTQLVDTLTAGSTANMNDKSWTVQFAPAPVLSLRVLAPGQSVTLNVVFKIRTTNSVPSGSSVTASGVVIWGTIIAL